MEWIEEEEEEDDEEYLLLCKCLISYFSYKKSKRKI